MGRLDVIEVIYEGKKVGKVALTKENLCAFEYDPDFIKTGFSISPYFLPLQPGLFYAKSHPFSGGFGVFDDSLPDGWGRLVQDRYLKSKGTNPDTLSVLDRLSFIGNTGRGALEYLPSANEKGVAIKLSFDDFYTQSQQILHDAPFDSDWKTFYLYSGSSGGARPKFFTKIRGTEYLVKFPASTDKSNIGQIEYEYSLLARKCGIIMADTLLVNNKYFASKRFDRIEKKKVHTISVAALLNANYRIPSLDYDTLLKLCFNLTKNIEEVYLLFRQMVFNIVISNRDDHAKLKNKFN